MGVWTVEVTGRGYRITNGIEEWFAAPSLGQRWCSFGEALDAVISCCHGKQMLEKGDCTGVDPLLSSRMNTKVDVRRTKGYPGDVIVDIGSRTGAV